MFLLNLIFVIKHQRGDLDKRKLEDKETPNIANEINIIGPKLQQFWKCDPAAWFKRAEAQLRLSHVCNSHTKFEHVLTMLDEDVIDK